MCANEQDCFNFVRRDDGSCAVRLCEELACDECGIEDRVGDDDLCAWCAADVAGSPHGRCRHCLGAFASDRTCACRPPGESR